MKIILARTIPLKGSATPDTWSGEEQDQQHDHTLIELISEDSHKGMGSVYAPEPLISAALDFVKAQIIGSSAKDPAVLIETLHQSTFWHGRGGTITHMLSGVDIALWDLWGQITGLSIGRLLGGRFREKIRPYASVFMNDLECLQRNLEDAKARGFRSFKIGWYPFGRKDDDELDEALVSHAREVIGDDCELMVDAGGSEAFWPHSPKWALEKARMLANYNVTWFEEPLTPDDMEGYAWLTARAPLPIAGGEVFTRRQSYAPWLANKSWNFVQPDTTKCGGLYETFQIARNAAEHGIVWVPHGWNTGVGLAADLQLASAISGARWIEYKTPAPFVDELMVNPPQLDENGMIDIPDKPGLGFEWSEEAIERFSA